MKFLLLFVAHRMEVAAQKDLKILATIHDELASNMNLLLPQ
jgi:hypothetical protein